MKTIVAAFAIIISAQLFVPGKMIYDKQKTLLFGQEYTFKTQPIDPYDPFRGKYVILEYADNFIVTDKEDEKWVHNDRVYVEFEESEDGYAKIKKLHKEVPENTNYYLKTRIGWIDNHNNKRVYIVFPFKRYYMEETKAAAAERMTSWGSRHEVSTVVCIYKGEASIQKLQVGEPMEERAIEDVLEDVSY